MAAMAEESLLAGRARARAAECAQDAAIAIRSGRIADARSLLDEAGRNLDRMEELQAEAASGTGGRSGA
jgi:hypothetical protein